MSTLLANVRAILTTTPARWMDLAQMLPAELLSTRPAPEEWSPVECLQHLIQVEAMYQRRVQAFLEGRDIPSFNPDETGAQKQGPFTTGEIEALAADYVRLRLDTLHALDALHEADLARTSHHSELGPVTLAQMLQNWAAHDFNHTIQAARALMQPFIRGSGPWEKYYAGQLMK